MSTTDSESLTADDVFEILSNQRRRMVLYYLRQHGDEAGVKELAEEIAAMENNIPVEELTSQQRKRVYVSLYQTHLPKMAENTVIEYDKDEGVVSLTEQTHTIDRYLSNGQQFSYPWRIHYIVLAVLGVSVMALTLIEAPVFAALSSLWAGVGLLFVFVISAAVQYWYSNYREAEVPPELSQ